MHIPDGYLSPQTCAAFGAGMVPFWTASARRVRRVVKTRYVPLIAIGAAYCFLVMMFNVPIPDGTTAHAVGGVLIAVLLGPWAAVVAVSSALAIQALFFGDGGVLAFGANCFNMALVMPMVGYGVYLLLTRHVSLTSARRAVAAGIGGYVGLNVAALCAATEFGLQPTLFHRTDGTPLYAPFHLAQTIPAMALAHLTVAGGVEFALTAGVIAYLQRANLPVLRINHAGVPEGDAEVVAPRRPGWRWALIGLGVMAVLTPLGLLAPGHAFGEDAPAGFWHHALFNGYDFSHDKHPTVGYLVSAGVGIVAVAIVVLSIYGLIRFVQRVRGVRNERERADRVTAVAGTPAWLTQPEVGLCPCGCIGKRRKGGFVEKTIGGAAKVMAQALFSDDIATKPGLLQAIDPRVKLASLFGLLVVAAFVRHIPVLIAMYVATLILAVTSGLALGFFVKRVWLFIPLFTGVVVLPAAFNFVTHGQIVLHLGTWFGYPVGLTRQGLNAAGLIVSRVAVSISLVVLLTLTTSWSRLLASLRSLFVPRMFVVVLGMTYRYVFHLLKGVTDMYTARKARTVTRDTDATRGRAFVAATGGAVFGKAHALSEEVHQAMVSRGYTGGTRTIQGARVRIVDVCWLAGCALCAIAVLGGDRVLGR